MSASSEPVTSALRIRLSVAASPRLDLLEDVLEAGAAAGATAVAAEVGRRGASARASRRPSRAVFSSGATTKSSPASATSDEAEHLDRRGRAGLLDLLALVVDERPHPAPGGAGDERVADLEGAALHEHGGDRAPADVEVAPRARRPRPRPSGLARRSSTLGDDEQVVEQVVDAEVLQRRDLDHRSCRRPTASGTRPCSDELLHAPGSGRRCSRSILLMATTIGTLGRLGVVDRLDRLGHHAVVGRHDQHDDVGGLGAAGAHGGERLVARRVDEGDRLAVLDRPGRRRCAG